MTDTEIGRLVVVSNRLPVVLSRTSDGHWALERGSGGLVTALDPVLRESSGMWMGWPGIQDGEIADADLKGALQRDSERLGYDLRGVSLTAKEQNGFYLGFSNQVVWPLFHDFPALCNFDPDFWAAYQSVNRKFADAIAAQAVDGDFLWIHDYHLLGVAEGLRKEGIHRPLGFFLHIPFPALDLFLKLPWRFPILRSLLHYDLIGFQAARDREHFLQALQVLVPSVEVTGLDGRIATLRVGTRTIRVGVFPISIDFDEFANTAGTESVAERVVELQLALQDPSGDPFRPTVMLLGVDRLDYSKGIPHKMRGLRLALRRYPELKGAVTLVQLIVPSREDIPEYYNMKNEIERLVGDISGEFTRPGWSPVQYHYGSWSRAELLAHYRAARIALVTPLKDGMNLVAKEYCAASTDDDGVLILSEHAGASAQLQDGGLIVNPYNVEEVADAIHQAYKMTEVERRERMSHLRDRIRARDIHWWVRTFLRAAAGEDLGPDTHLSRYHPPIPEGFLDEL